MLGTSYVDATAPYGVPLVYTVRAVVAGNPKVEGLPAEELPVFFADVYPPPAPPRLDALSEGNLVRLIWAPSTRRISRAISSSARRATASRCD